MATLQPSPRNRLLTEREVSQITGRSQSALQKDRLRREGIPFVRIGRSIRYMLADVQQFIASRRIETDAPGS